MGRLWRVRQHPHASGSVTGFARDSHLPTPDVPVGPRRDY